MEEVIERMLELIGIEATLMVLPRLCEQGQAKIRKLQRQAKETMGMEGPLIGFEPLAPPGSARAFRNTEPKADVAAVAAVAKTKAKPGKKGRVMSRAHRDAISRGRQAAAAKRAERWAGQPKSLQDIGEEPAGARSLSEALDEPIHIPVSQ
jgi:hypothetical protein